MSVVDLDRRRRLARLALDLERARALPPSDERLGLLAAVRDEAAALKAELEAGDPLLAWARRERVTAADAAALGLLPGREFWRAAPGEDLRCWRCDRPAAFVTGDERAWCLRHARDF